MSTEACRTCAGVVASGAWRCPHCGQARPTANPDERPLALTMIYALVAAGVAIALLSIIWPQ